MKSTRWAVARQSAAALALAAVIGGSTVLMVRPAVADADLRIKNAVVTVEPEYDEPRVLVVQTGTFAGSDFPKEVSFYLPLGVEITEVCGLKKPQDEHLCQLFETKTEGKSTVMTFKLPVSDYYFEFYYSPVQGSGSREIAYSYLPYYPVDNLEIAVQQPLRSTGFTTTPPSSRTYSDSEGFKYYQNTFSGLSPKQAVDISIAYQKSDERPSVAKKNPAGASAGGADDKTGLIALGIGGAGALGFFGYLLVRRRPEAVQVTPGRAGQPAQGGARQATAPVATRQTTAQRPRGKAVRVAFCSKCGASLQGDENFCSGCGQRVRR